MLFTLGIGSSTSDVGAIMTIIHDKFPRWRKELIDAGICISGFLLGLVYVTPVGHSFMSFGCGICLVVGSFCEMYRAEGKF